MSSKVTKAFEQDYKTRYAEEVAKIAQQGGEKDRIDTADELEALRELPQKLANQAGISRGEMGYILEQSPKDLKETEEKAVKDARNEGHVRDEARKAVDRLKNDVTPNKALDNEAEARMLLMQIVMNSQNHQWNDHEIEYFKMELIKAGFGDLLNELTMSTAPVESKAGSEEEADAVPKNEQDGKGGVSAEPGETEPADEPVEYNIPPEEPGKTEESGNKSEPIGDDGKKTSPAKPKKTIKNPLPIPPSPRLAPEPDEPGDASTPVTTYRISKDDELKGITTARNLLSEIDSTFYTNNATVASALKEVNDRNAYYFIGTFINDPSHEGLAVEVLGISDRFSKTKLSFSNITPVIESLLNQAAELGLEQDGAYRELKQKNDKLKQKPVGYDGDKDEQTYVDTLIADLYNKMSEKIG